jgi:hypothetical protein
MAVFLKWFVSACYKVFYSTFAVTINYHDNIRKLLKYIFAVLCNGREVLMFWSHIKVSYLFVILTSQELWLVLKKRSIHMGTIRNGF